MEESNPCSPTRSRIYLRVSFFRSLSFPPSYLFLLRFFVEIPIATPSSLNLPSCLIRNPRLLKVCQFFVPLPRHDFWVPSHPSTEVLVFFLSVYSLSFPQSAKSLSLVLAAFPAGLSAFGNFSSFFLFPLLSAVVPLFPLPLLAPLSSASRRFTDFTCAPFVPEPSVRLVFCAFLVTRF